jgi:hypothetical protein
VHGALNHVRKNKNCTVGIPLNMKVSKAKQSHPYDKLIVLELYGHKSLGLGFIPKQEKFVYSIKTVIK